jgi:Concanavalin A-like lectin/glucanases superfamily
MAYPDEVLADAPLGYWRLGESAGTAAADASGNARHGTYTGNYTLGVAGLAPGAADAAVQLDGASGCVAVPAAGLGLGAGPGSLEAWLRLDAGYTGNPRALAFGANLAWELFVDGPSRRLNLFNLNGGVRDTGYALTLGAVYHVVVAIAAAGGGGQTRVYVNGAQVFGETTSAVTSNAGMALAIGQSGNNADYWKGAVDEVAVYGSALPLARAQAHYWAGLGQTGRTAPLALEGAVSPPPPPEAVRFSLGEAVLALPGADDRGLGFWELGEPRAGLRGPAGAAGLRSLDLTGYVRAYRYALLGVGGRLAAAAVAPLALAGSVVTRPTAALALSGHTQSRLTAALALSGLTAGSASTTLALTGELVAAPAILVALPLGGRVLAAQLRTTPLTGLTRATLARALGVGGRVEQVGLAPLALTGEVISLSFLAFAGGVRVRADLRVGLTGEVKVYALPPAAPASAYRNQMPWSAQERLRALT